MLHFVRKLLECCLGPGSNLKFGFLNFIKEIHQPISNPKVNVHLAKMKAKTYFGEVEYCLFTKEEGEM